MLPKESDRKEQQINNKENTENKNDDKLIKESRKLKSLKSHPNTK